jgi:hypothetical protein
VDLNLSDPKQPLGQNMLNKTFMRGLMNLLTPKVFIVALIVEAKPMAESAYAGESSK